MPPTGPGSQEEAQKLHPCYCNGHLDHRQIFTVLADSSRVKVGVCPLEDTRDNALAVNSGSSGGIVVTDMMLPSAQAQAFKAPDLNFLSIIDHSQAVLFDYQGATLAQLYDAC